MGKAGTSNISHVSRKRLQSIAATTPVTGHVVGVTLSKLRFETIPMPMICSLIEHGFLPVFSMVGKIILNFNTLIWDSRNGRQPNALQAIFLHKVSSLRVQPSLRLLLKSYFCDFNYYITLLGLVSLIGVCIVN